MTKKHYYAIAKLFSTIKPSDDKVVILHGLVLILEMENNRFDRERFFEACNYVKE